jgi:disulfide bond formation protein DsbB
MMSLSRLLFLAIGGICVVLMSVALYMEYVMGLEPCPLCMLQRGAVTGTGVIALAAAAIGPRGWGVRLGGIGVALVSVVGVTLAGRQLWLQNLPEDAVPPCGPGYDYLRETFPLTEVIRMAFEGSGDCAEVQWTFLGLSIPGWTLLFFVAVAVTGLFLLFRGPGRRDIGLLR